MGALVGAQRQILRINVTQWLVLVVDTMEEVE